MVRILLVCLYVLVHYVLVLVCRPHRRQVVAGLVRPLPPRQQADTCCPAAWTHMGYIYAYMYYIYIIYICIFFVIFLCELDPE